MEKLFEEVGFVYEYREEFVKFYRPYFLDEDELYGFFRKVFKHDNIDKTPRRIMNQIVHLVSLANDIEKIRPARDSLRIVFLQTCIESIYKLSGDNGGKYKEKDRTNFYMDMLDEDGKQYILGNFKFSFLEPAYMLDERGRLLFDKHGRDNLKIEDFALLLYKMRGMVLHEGDYWSMQFFAYDTDSTWLVSIETDKKILNFQEAKKDMPIQYHFETTMQYEEFIHHFVKGCIRFLEEYLMFKNYI